MKVTNISINNLENKAHTYLYNEMFAFAKKHQISGRFGRDYIELSGVAENLLKEIEDKGIKFMRVG